MLSQRERRQEVERHEWLGDERRPEGMLDDADQAI
jgi:hypothetical protein